MLSEQKIQILNRLRVNYPDRYQVALKKFGLSEKDVPIRNVPVNLRNGPNTDKRQTYYMGGKPYYGEPPLKKTVVRTKSDKVQAKREAALFIDGENISYRKAERIFQVVRNRGKMVYARVYGLKNDRFAAGWKGQTDKQPKLTFISILGGSRKDKVDKRIQKDAIRTVSANIPLVCFALSDAGYAKTIERLKESRKTVILICEEKAPDRLRQAASECVVI